jgi:hypothetical protein
MNNTHVHFDTSNDHKHVFIFTLQLAYFPREGILNHSHIHFSIIL